MGKSSSEDPLQIDGFSRKVIKATLIVILLVLIIALILKGFKVILLVIAGALIAIFFHGIAGLIKSRIPVNRTVSLIIAVVLFLGVCVGVGFLLYPRVDAQLSTLEEQLPQAAQETKEKLMSNRITAMIVNQIERIAKNAGESGKQITSFFSSFLGGLGDLYVIFFLGMFFMFDPTIYYRGLRRLAPPKYRERTGVILRTIHFTLKKWLMGKLLSMILVGILTGIGLSLLGIPLALTLALFATVITFIPNFGPLLSLIPAFLLAFTIGPDYAIYVILLYAGIQAIESNVLTPLIQKRMISFPPAMIFVAQVILGIFTGVLGLILAVPVVALVMVTVKMVYLEDILGESIEVKGEEQAEARAQG